MYSVVDLFSGAGGLSLGFEQTNKFEVKVAIEKHSAAQLTYKANHNSNVTVLDDILSITDFEDFNFRFGQIDVVIGGPPCQGFSNANRQKFDLISQNNSLVKKYIEFVEKLKPKAFVIENVPMFKSDVHRFYLSDNDDQEFLKDYLIDEKISLYEGDFIYGIEELKKMVEEDEVQQFLIEKRLLKDLILLISKAKVEGKLNDLIQKRGKQYIENIKNTIARYTCKSDYFENYIKYSLKLFIDFITKLQSDRTILYAMQEFIKVQRCFYIMQELRSNSIRIINIDTKGKKIEVHVKSITVYNYLIKKLEVIYKIDSGVINAALFGAPQKRKRFFALGIRKDLITNKEIEISLPRGLFNEGNYRTVGDAIGDLVEINPQYETTLPAIPLVKLEKMSDLTKLLRDSDLLHNHIITQTRAHILKRFEQLKQGQNFHDLDKSIINTYADPSRTQNSIYKRLDFNAPSPTVTNARKAMWIHPTINRAISIREAARLQTFPDSFVFKGSKDAQYQQVGNAVPPIMSNAIARQLLNILTKL
ncbi:DNA cytosine methyltransferase [Lysinibacillus antri]|uniref:DNA cytosine methyltransferase n=1 Tax=Lysinibacillus antri TaxID=2498145 RepID=UPI001319C5CD|nr:DNA cytosine methyltransferase [Lysinibacillus antri]